MSLSQDIKLHLIKTNIW